MKQNKIYFILTTGRSGSSLFVKLLETLGPKVPDPLRINKLFFRLINKYNPKGHFENIDVLQANEKIFISNKFAWFTIEKKISKKSEKSFEKKINNVFSKFSNLNYDVILKDPRLTTTIYFWFKQAEKNNLKPVLFFLYRSPSEFINSVQERNNLESYEIEGNWLNETIKILTFLQKKDFYFVSTNDLINKPDTILNLISKIENLNINSDKANEFNEKFFEKKLLRSLGKKKKLYVETENLSKQIEKLNNFQKGHNIRIHKSTIDLVHKLSKTQKRSIKYHIKLIFYFFKAKLRFIYSNHKINF
jgi:hypothetical protein